MTMDAARQMYDEDGFELEGDDLDRAEQERAAEVEKERMKAFVAILTTEVNRRIQRRDIVERRWLDDLRQYHGYYDPDLLKRLQDMEGSQVNINMTAPKTDALVARLWDLLFPTDDRNYSVAPTPVPEMTEEAERIAAEIERLNAEADQMMEQAQQQVDAQNPEGAAATEAEARQVETNINMLQDKIDEMSDRMTLAKSYATLMQEEIDDQLVTCNYQAEARDAIEDACKIGMGVLKGPVLGDQGKQHWRHDKDENGQTIGWSLDIIDDRMPAAYRVDPWSFFPDPDVRKVSHSNGFYERHLLNKMQMRKLAKRSDIDKDAVRELLKGSPDRGSTPTYLADLHDLTNQSSGDISDRYHVFEYTGPIETEDMQMLMAAFAKDGQEPEELDELEEFHARIWFCQGHVLSFAMHPLDSNEPIYSVFTIRADEASLFGFGIPYIMRHPQSVMNGAFRMMMDNSGLSTGPQVIVNKDAVTPEDGSWTLRARKIWLRNSTASMAGVPGFETFNIPSNQGELANIIALSNETIDTVTSMPALAQGEQGSGVTKTAQGMALLMNSTNVTFRRIVKNFDDDVTVPMIRRFYHWNMQFSNKESIKGDYEVQARGSGALLVREMQAQNLIMIAQMFGDHPVFGPRLKHGALLGEIFKAHMIPMNDLVMTEREFRKWQKEQEEKQDPMAAAEQAKAQAIQEEVAFKKEELSLKQSMHEREWAGREKVAQLNYDAAMEKAALSMNLTREELDAKVADAAQERERKERSLAVEVAMKNKPGEGSGGLV
jgi:hypothetical protein